MSVSIAVVGSFMTDFIFETPKRPVKGETVIGKSFHLATGGKGANQAMAAALLGADVSMVGRIGRDMFGDMQIESLTKAGVHTECIIRDPEQGTGVAAIVLDSAGDNSIVIVPRANMACKIEDVAAAKPCIEKADYVLLQLEIPMKVNRRAVETARKLGKKVILDPAPACVLEDFFFENVDIVTPNETEATLLSGEEVTDVASAERAAREIARRGVRTVIVTLGEQGALVCQDGDCQLFSPYSIKTVDTTAAGDAFTGSLAVWLGEGFPLDEAVRRACMVGALTASRLGAQPSLPSRADFESFRAAAESA
jgi:ribokinase